MRYVTLYYNDTTKLLFCREKRASNTCLRLYVYKLNITNLSKILISFFLHITKQNNYKGCQIF